MPTAPDCTIAIPVFNRRTLHRHAVDSALAQDLEGLEVLVVDNCSDDGTWEELQERDDPRLRLVRNERNLGLFGNLDRCLELHRGRTLRILCSDDWLPPGCIRRELELLDAHPQAALVVSPARLWSSERELIGLAGEWFPPGEWTGDSAQASWFWVQALYAFNPFPPPSGQLMRSSIVARTGTYGSGLGAIADVDYALRMLEHGSLLVSAEVGAELLCHEQQAGTIHQRDAGHLADLQNLIERHEGITERAALTALAKRRVAALAFGWWVRAMRRGRPQALAQVRRSGIGLSGMLRAALPVVANRAGRRVLGRSRRLPLVRARLPA
jgi:glycosyltransferase involved in cell wall biosynthesis